MQLRPRADVRRQRAHAAHERRRRIGQVQLAVGGRDLLGIRRALLGLRRERRRRGELRPAAGPPPRRARVDAACVELADRKRLLRRDRARRRARRPCGGSSPRSTRRRPESRARPAPRRASAAAATGARSATARARAAPAGCRGRRRTPRPSARSNVSGSSGRSGWNTGMPSRAAASLAGGAASLRPAAGRRVRPREQKLDVVRGREPLEHVGSEGAVAATAIRMPLSAARRAAAARRAPACGARRRCGR